ncbi:unnamed protein product [Aureobasidium pullulans]|nr:unnamed protein product [Aureobasidium pullulans]
MPATTTKNEDGTERKDSQEEAQTRHYQLPGVQVGLPGFLVPRLHYYIESPLWAEIPFTVASSRPRSPDSQARKLNLDESSAAHPPSSQDQRTRRASSLSPIQSSPP